MQFPPPSRHCLMYSCLSRVSGARGRDLARFTLIYRHLLRPPLSALPPLRGSQPLVSGFVSVPAQLKFTDL